MKRAGLLSYTAGNCSANTGCIKALREDAQQAKRYLITGVAGRAHK